MPNPLSRRSFLAGSLLTPFALAGCGGSNLTKGSGQCGRLVSRVVWDMAMSYINDAVPSRIV